MSFEPLHRCLWQRSVLTCLALFVLPQPLLADGLLIYKPSPSHPDDSAQAIEFSSVESRGPIEDFILKNGQRFAPLPDSFRVKIDYMTFAGITVSSASQLPAIETQLSAYAALAKKYPKAKAILDTHAAEAAEIVRRVKGGEVWDRDSWVHADRFNQKKTEDQKAKQDQYAKTEVAEALKRENGEKAAIEKRHHKE